jgi:[acyl-carrier-protein] S-malonyltransferase
VSATVAILCSGQGTQHAGMFDLVAQAPEAQAVLEAAREALDGRHPQQFVREADPTQLYSNRHGQILCCTQALAAWAMIRPHLGKDVVIAGYSVGELAAWGCAGLLTPAEVLRLASARAEAMDEAAGVGGGLEAIIGLGRARLESLCRPHDAHIAIVNGEDFFVVGGKRDALASLGEEARAAGARRATILHVGVPSHTPLLAAASQRFGDALGRFPLSNEIPDGLRLLSGVDGDAVLDVAAGLKKLAAQISQPLDWNACLDSCRAAGAGTVLELGPGHALADLARQVMPRAQVRSVDDFRTPDGVRNWLSLY